MMKSSERAVETCAAGTEWIAMIWSSTANRSAPVGYAPQR